MRYGAIVRYAGGWLLAGGLLAALIPMAVPEQEQAGVTLPPVREIDLAAATRRAGCELSRDSRAQDLRPPADGGPATPAAPGVYDRRPPVRALIGAVRAGIVVIHYRPDLPRTPGTDLDALHAAVPSGTIVTPNEDMPYAVAVTAWRRLLGCPALTAQALDAVRLFRGRFIGSGPDVDGYS